MKMVKLIIVALCMVVGANNVSAQKADKKASKETEVTFKTSIHCNNCAERVKKNIPFDEKGVKDITVNVETKEVTIKYRTDKTDKEKLKKAIEKLGYTAEEVTAVQTTAELSKKQGCCSTATENCNSK